MQLKIGEAQTAREIARCFPVMRQLRTHFEDEQMFVAQVQRQRAAGFRMAFLEDGEGVRAVAGYRISESLFAGRFCYVDDLVTDEAARSLGYGGALFDWLAGGGSARGGLWTVGVGFGRTALCRPSLSPDERMIISSHHFSLTL